MKHNSKYHSTSVSIPGDVLVQLDAWRDAQRVPPSRSAAIMVAVKAFLAEQAAEGGEP